jgi:hypothetical protein
MLHEAVVKELAVWFESEPLSESPLRKNFAPLSGLLTCARQATHVLSSPSGGAPNIDLAMAAAGPNTRFQCGFMLDGDERRPSDSILSDATCLLNLLDGDD